MSSEIVRAYFDLVSKRDNRHELTEFFMDNDFSDLVNTDTIYDPATGLPLPYDDICEVAQRGQTLFSAVADNRSKLEHVYNNVGGDLMSSQNAWITRLLLLCQNRLDAVKNWNDVWVDAFDTDENWDKTTMVPQIYNVISAMGEDSDGARLLLDLLRTHPLPSVATDVKDVVQRMKSGSLRHILHPQDPRNIERMRSKRGTSVSKLASQWAEHQIQDNELYSVPFMRQSGDISKVRPITDALGNSYTVNHKFPVTDELFHDVPPTVIRDMLAPNEIAYFTYSVTDKGIFMARYRNIFEIGVGHEMLCQKQARECTVHILVAGEMEINKAANTLVFNFMSGTFTLRMNLNHLGDYQEFLIETLKELFNLDERPFAKVTFTEQVLFPKIFPTMREIEKMCEKDPERNLLTERKNGRTTAFCEKIPLQSLDDAVEYFSTHPWEPIEIFNRADRKWYTNSDQTHPSHFVVSRSSRYSRSSRSRSPKK